MTSMQPPRRYVDDCQHTFEDLATHVLPKDMERLSAAMLSPIVAESFCKVRCGPAEIARSLGLPSDFSGCYVLLDQGSPIYVGISRTVLARLRQHFLGSTHSDASLSYSIAQKRKPTPGTRADAMIDAGFRDAFNKAQSYLRSTHVAFVEIRNPLELYVFEAFAAIQLGTFDWNTFRTH